MDATKARVRRYRRHAERLARFCARYAGSLRDVAEAVGVSVSRVGHKRTDDPDGPLVKWFVGTLTHPKADAMAILEAMEQAIELHDVVRMDDEALGREVCALLAMESEEDGAEDNEALFGPLAHADALERYILRARRLVLALREAVERGVDPYALYRASRT